MSPTHGSSQSHEMGIVTSTYMSNRRVIKARCTKARHNDALVIFNGYIRCDRPPDLPHLCYQVRKNAFRGNSMCSAPNASDYLYNAPCSSTIKHAAFLETPEELRFQELADCDVLRQPLSSPCLEHEVAC